MLVSRSNGRHPEVSFLQKIIFCYYIWQHLFDFIAENTGNSSKLLHQTDIDSLGHPVHPRVGPGASLFQRAEIADRTNPSP
jgi:hypothetical protein